jgi:hypothetical protein
MKRLILPLLAALSAVPLAAQPSTGTAKIVGYDKVPWGATRADVIQQHGPSEFETSDGLGPEMTAVAYKSEVGLLAFTIHERDGLIQVARSSVLRADECDATFAGLVSTFRETLAPLQPVGAIENPTADDLCTAVRDGRARARYTWTDPVNDATATLEIKPGAGTLQMYLATPRYREWYASQHGPAGPERPSASESPPRRREHRALDALVAHLRAAGLPVGEVEGSDDLGVISVDGRKISVFGFAGPSDRAVLDEIRRKGAIEVGDKSFPVVINGAWVLTIDRDHPRWRAIEAAFRSF